MKCECFSLLENQHSIVLYANNADYDDIYIDGKRGEALEG